LSEFWIFFWQGRYHATLIAEYAWCVGHELVYVAGPRIARVTEEMHVTDAAAAVGISAVATTDKTIGTLIADDTTTAAKQSVAESCCYETAVHGRAARTDRCAASASLCAHAAV